MVAFIESDIMDFVTSVCGHEKTKLEDLQPKLIFEAIDNKERFVFVPPFQVNASGFKYNQFKEWGLELIQKDPIQLPTCATHGSHAVFYGQ